MESDPRKSQLDDNEPAQEDDVVPCADSVAPSAIASRIEKVRKLTLAAAESRTRLPQPLFWSLFHSELTEVKRQKAAKRLLDSILSDS